MGNTVQIYLDANMVEHTSAHASARDWRMVMLVGGTSFAVSYVLLHFVFPVASSPEPVVSIFLAVVIALIAMALTLALLSRNLRVDR